MFRVLFPFFVCHYSLGALDEYSCITFCYKFTLLLSSVHVGLENTLEIHQGLDSIWRLLPQSWNWLKKSKDISFCSATELFESRAFVAPGICILWIDLDGPIIKIDGLLYLF